MVYPTEPTGRVRTLEERIAEDGEVRFNSPVEVMQFTLTYSGKLPAARTGAEQTRLARKDDKHDIRRAFHPQLRDLWNSRIVMQRALSKWLAAAQEEREAWETHPDPHPEWQMIQPQRMGSFTFVPLVTTQLQLLCELDILFLRAEPRGSVLSVNGAGDLDNRLKVLFDALTVPMQPNQLPDAAEPSPEEFPFFCLLANDQHITGIRVDSERLLHPPDPTWVELIVRVTVRTNYLGLHNMWLLGSG